VGQCKAQIKKTSSADVRGFESALLRESPSVVGIFVSERGFSPAAQQHFRESRLPLMLVHLVVGKSTSDDEAPPTISTESFMLNDAARKQLPRVSIAQRIVPHGEGKKRAWPVVIDDGVVVAKT